MSDQGIQVDEVHARTVLGAQPAPNIKGIGIAVIVYPNPNEEVIKSLVDQRSAQRMARDRYRVTPNAMKITVDAEPFDSDDARRLVTALDEHLASRYSPDQRFGPNLKPEHLASGLGTFVIARVGGRAIGCGAVRRLDEITVEVKRMYVEPALRGQGVAKEILGHLETAARAMGAHRLVLETGTYQAEAIGLYRRAGYSPVDCWGEYADCPTSACFEKRI